MKFLKATYLILSGLSFLLVFGVLIVFIFAYTPIGISHNADPIFTLNHGNIVTDQDYEVVYSQQSPPVFNGDHLDYYCIQLEKFEFQLPNEIEWVFGKEQNTLFGDARKQTARMGMIEKCFKGESDAESNDVASKIWKVNARRNYIDGAVVLLYHRQTKRLLYVSFQT